MDCIALYDSGNYAYRMCSVFEHQRLVFQVISTPCKISRTGCSYCLLFPEEYLENVVSQSLTYGCPVREAYRIVPTGGRYHYERLI